MSTTSRRFIKVSMPENNHLSEQFPFLDQLEWEDNIEGLNKIAVSVFDHWLTNKEAETLLQNESQEIRKTRNLSLHKFSCSLLNRYSCLTYRFTGRSKRRVVFRKFTSERAANEYVEQSENSCSSKFHFRLVIPEISAIYFEGWDYTNYLYILELKYLSEIASLAEQYKIHLIK